MSIYYRGAPVSTYWHKYDARIRGFSPVEPLSTKSTVDRVMNHITESITHSPFISFTKSFGIAREYATRKIASPTKPGFVYEIDLPDPLPKSVEIIFPIKMMICNELNRTLDVDYHYEGDSRLLIGIIDPRNYRNLLNLQRKLPFDGPERLGSVVTTTKKLKTIVFCLRDAEVLVKGEIPKEWVFKRYEVY